MPAPIPIGKDIFRSIRELGIEYIDKTRFIKDVLDMVGTEVLLPSRPRRFGKTVNMTMLEAYLARSTEDLSHLFEGLDIRSAGESYRKHFQRYPTLFLSFKSVKPDSPEAWESEIARKLSALYRSHIDLLRSGLLDGLDRQDFQAVLERKADRALKQDALLLLSEWLHRAHGEQVLILVDEYDTPVDAAWMADRRSRAGRARQLTGEEVKILPAFINGGTVPAILAGVKYADLVGDWVGGVGALLRAIR